MTKKERRAERPNNTRKIIEWCNKNTYNHKEHQGGHLSVWKDDKRIELFLQAMTFHDLTLKAKGNISELPDFLDKWLIDKHLTIQKEISPTLF